jgi:uncharacterized protein (DUF58 family)
MLVYLPLTLLLCVLALVVSSNTLWDTALFMLALYLLLRVWTWRVVRAISIERHFPDHAFTGDAVSVDLSIRNGSLLPIPWMEVEETVPMELCAVPLTPQAISLGSRDTLCIPYTLLCRHRGYYHLGPAIVRTGDLLGLDQRLFRMTDERHIIVYPRVVSLQRLRLPTHSAQIALPSRTPLFEDPARVIGVRDYVPTDSPRHIHWTASARAGQLLVKQYHPAIARATTLCLDLDMRSYEPRNRSQIIELAIVTAASLAHHTIMRDRLEVGLATEALDPLVNEIRHFHMPPGSQAAHLMNLLEVLARVQPTSGERFTTMLREASATLPWGGTVVAITGSRTASLDETLLYLRQLGFAVALILIQEHDVHGTLPGIAIHQVWADPDLARL